MRLMQNVETKAIYKVIEHIITRNFWEYYVLDESTNVGSIKFCLVLGFENEFGDVCLDEIKPYIMTRIKLTAKDDIFAPPGYHWITL